MKSSKITFVLTAVAAIALVVGATGCDKKETAGEKIDNASDKLKAAAGDAKDAVKDAANKTGDAIKEGAKATKDAVTNAVNSITNTNK